VTSITDDYILYEVPIKIDGRLYNLTVAYDIEDAEYNMLTARLDESETSGIPARGERLLVPGDVVTTVFLAFDNDNDDTEYFDDETFTISRNTSFEELTLPDGNYAFTYMMTDSRDEYYYSEVTALVMEDGWPEFIH